MSALIDTFVEMFSYSFLVRAFIVGGFVSLCAALLGVSLVLKRYSMIGDGLSHVGFGALAVATGLNLAPLTVSIPIVLVAAFLLLRLSEKSRIKGDAAIALISTSSLAVGVVIISQTTGMNTDVCNYLFGSILAMNKTDVYLSIVLSILVLIVFIVCYHKLFAITFDETFAQATGVRTNLYTMLIAFLTAITIVLGMRMMGAMLISALIIFPALSSMRVFKTFKSVTVSSLCISILCFFIGIFISYTYATPTGASIVLMNIIAFIVFGIINSLIKRGISMKKIPLILCSFLVFGCTGKTVSLNKTSTLTVSSSNAPVVPASTQIVPVSSTKTTVGLTVKSPAGPHIEIKEKMFIAQVNDIYLNTDDYIGKTIKVAGLFKVEDYGKNPYYFILRYGPGCCGTDGTVGFEVAWDGAETSYPAVDDWVEAVGTLSMYQENGYPYLYLALSELNVLDERGAEFVSQ
ncbi:zinc transport system permease protein [Pillotina sp. SPG140]